MGAGTEERPEAFGRAALTRALQKRERFLTRIVASLESFVTVERPAPHARRRGHRKLLGRSRDEVIGQDVRGAIPAQVLQPSPPEQVRPRWRRVPLAGDGLALCARRD